MTIAVTMCYIFVECLGPRCGDGYFTIMALCLQATSQFFASASAMSLASSRGGAVVQPAVQHALAPRLPAGVSCYVESLPASISCWDECTYLITCQYVVL